MRAYAQESGGAADGGSGGDGETVTLELPASAVQEPETDDAPQQVDVDPGAIIERVDGWLDAAIRAVPNILVALVLIAVVAIVATWVARFVQRRVAGRGREDLGRMIAGLLRWALIIGAVLLGLTIVLPTLRPGDLIAGLGVGSVAIGFAFKDILQNWLSGLLILLRQPFEIGDQIVVGGFEGTVERIETRSTILKTYDNQRAVIPNGEVYTSSVLVKTAAPKRRSQYDIGIGYGDGIGEAVDVLTAAIASVEGVESDPAPEALCWDLSASWVTIRMRWWTASDRASEVHTWSRVLRAAKEALDEAGIDMPYDTQVQLFHDQTEETDGRRAEQREGWPSQGEDPVPARERAGAGSARQGSDTAVSQQASREPPREATG